MRSTPAWLMIAGCCLIAGCQHDDPNVEVTTLPPPRPAVTQQDVYNYAALGPFPLPVREAFMRDFPESAVTSADIQPVTAGAIQYRIVFVRDGRPQSAIYDRAGVIVTPPAPPRIEDRPGIPENPAPAGPPITPPLVEQ